MASFKPSAYAQAGVDIDAQEKGLARVKKLAKSTFTPGVLTEIGSFGGLFRPDLQGMTEPVLVASADGVGTKLVVAKMAGDYSSVGRDLVNHCVNDEYCRRDRDCTTAAGGVCNLFCPTKGCCSYPGQ